MRDWYETWDKEAPMPGPSELARLEEEEGDGEFVPNVKDTNPKDAIGSSKPPLSTVPMPVLFEVGAAMLEGACKYARHNYRVAGVRSSVYFDAAMRHLTAWWEGEDTDQDSGMSHITKAIAGLVVLRDAQMNGMVANDDRPPRAREGWMADVQERVTGILARFPNPLPPYVQEADELEGPELVLTVNLPVADTEGVVYDFRETVLERLDPRDEAHGIAVMEALADGQYLGRVVSLYRNGELIANRRRVAVEEQS